MSLVQLTTSKSAARAVAGSKADLKIGDLAKATGKTQRALRLYEEMGLLLPSERTHGGFRVYDCTAIERVSWIGKLQELGFTLHQIQELVPDREPSLPKEAMKRVRRVFAEKQAEVAQQIARLQQLQREMATSLEYLETCVDACTESHVGTSSCCSCQTHGAQKAPSLVEGIRS